MNLEIWKDIHGYEGLYQVSNLGNVKSKRKVLKCVNDVYLCVSLHKDKRQKKHNIHTLVFSAFNNYIPSRKSVIDHINSNKHDNRLENLQLISQRMNATKDRKSNTGLTGVYEFRGRFNSSIRINGIKKHLGVYDTKEKAYQAYKKELEKL
jgi:hypothetical protein